MNIHFFQRPALKKILSALGNIFTLAAVFYLLVTLVENAGRITIVFSFALLPVTALFCVTHLLHACVLRSILNKKIGYGVLLNVHCASQLYKYIPGNIAHYFSRWMRLSRHGVSVRENARLILYESLWLVVTCALFGGIFFVTSGWANVVARLPAGWEILLGGVVCASVAMWIVIQKKGVHLHARQLGIIFLCSLSVLLFGLILCILNTYMVPEIGGIGFAQFTSGFAASFLAGFVVPGSPGGIGIREFVFVEIFKHGGNEAYLLTQLIVLFRLVAVASELLMFCLTQVLLQRRSA